MGFSQIGFADAVAWADYLAGTSVADLAVAWGISTINMNAVLVNFAQGSGYSSSWTAAQRARALALNPD
jgi:hypothetical protein